MLTTKLGTSGVMRRKSMKLNRFDFCSMTRLRKDSRRSDKCFSTRDLPRKEDRMLATEAPTAAAVQTKSSARGNGNKVPETIDRKMEPGIVKDCQFRG